MTISDTKLPAVALPGLAALLLTLGGCSMVERLWSSGPRELPRVRDGAIDFRCDANRALTVRPDGAAAAWLVMPDREVRLDSVAPGRFANGRSTLTLRDGEATLEEGGATTFANCKRVAAP
jgi:hypothetical protein